MRMRVHAGFLFAILSLFLACQGQDSSELQPAPDAGLDGAPADSAPGDGALDGPLADRADEPLPYPQNLRIRSDHPYLFAAPELLTTIRSNTQELEGFSQSVKQSRQRSTSDPTDLTAIRQEVDTRVANEWTVEDDCMFYGLKAYLIHDALSLAYGQQYLDSVLAQPFGPEQSNDGPPRNTLYALGVLYDWLYADLDAAKRNEVRARILSLAEYIESKWHYISRPSYSGGHSRWANAVALVALLAIRHEIDSDAGDEQARYYALLGQVVTNWRDGYNPTQSWISQDGGYHMGWAYGTSYTGMHPYLAWTFATEEESWLDSWQGEQGYFYLYGIRNANGYDERQAGGFDQFNYSGDVWDTAYSPLVHGSHLIVAASLHHNAHARWLYETLKEQPGYSSYWDLLYRHYQEEPAQPPDDLPLARHFRNSGFVLMRDSWSLDRNTLLEFKSTSFYSDNHHHKDQNAFTIYYKGPLAIDSGGYNVMGGYGTPHWWNYYTRSVAHNTILVYDRSESYGQSPFGPNSNDGGQRFLDGYPTLSQMQQGGADHLDGIIAFENRTDFAYAQGDATLAYSPHKMKEYKRSVVYLRNQSYAHPVILVYDKVIATSPDYLKTYLLHSISEPRVQNQLAQIEITNGMDEAHRAVLYQETLLPESPQIAIIGGHDNAQEFWMADDGTGQPHNYTEQLDSSDTRALREAGQWRLEIHPGEGHLDDRFLHVLSITDALAGQGPISTQSLSSSHLDGVLIQDSSGLKQTAVLFTRGQEPLDEVVSVPSGDSVDKVLLVGLAAGKAYLVERQDGRLIVRQDQNGSLVSSDQGVLWVPVQKSSFRPEVGTGVKR